MYDLRHRIEEKPDGSKRWYQDNQLHRLDGPAIEYANGTKYWFQNGLRHRIDGPAVEYADGDKEWYQNGLRHRIDGPAVEYADEHKKWYLNDQLHRVDGPAVEYLNGSKKWYLNGKKAIKIKNQTIENGKKVIINNSVGIVLRHIEGIFYEVLFGNKKILVVSSVK